MKSIAYYEADIQEFLMANEEAVLGALAMRHGFALEYQQKLAWQGQIQLLRRFLPKSIIGWIYFEFTIPRMGKRVDVIVVTGGVGVSSRRRSWCRSTDPVRAGLEERVGRCGAPHLAGGLGGIRAAEGGAGE